MTGASSGTAAFLRRSSIALLFCASGIAAPAHAAERAATPVPAAAKVPRLRALDFRPFEPALSRFTLPQAIEVHALLRDATIPQVQAALVAGRLTSETLTLYFLDRIHRHDERLRTYVELNPAALDEARAADARRKAGRPLGPLDGIPSLVSRSAHAA